MVGTLPGSIRSGISVTFSASVPAHASRATSLKTLYFRCCTLVSNFLILPLLCFNLVSSVENAFVLRPFTTGRNPARRRKTHRKKKTAKARKPFRLRAFVNFRVRTKRRLQNDARCVPIYAFWLASIIFAFVSFKEFKRA